MVREWIANDSLEDHLRSIAAADPTWGHHLVAMDLWSAITTAMGDQGITQTELAERAGLKQSYVSRILSNPEQISLRTAFRLCNALGLELVVKAQPKAESLPDEAEAKRSKRRPAAERQAARRAVATR